MDKETEDNRKEEGNQKTKLEDNKIKTYILKHKIFLFFSVFTILNLIIYAQILSKQVNENIQLNKNNNANLYLLNTPSPTPNIIDNAYGISYIKDNSLLQLKSFGFWSPLTQYYQGYIYVYFANILTKYEAKLNSPANVVFKNPHPKNIVSFQVETPYIYYFIEETDKDNIGFSAYKYNTETKEDIEIGKINTYPNSGIPEFLFKVSDNSYVIKNILMPKSLYYMGDEDCLYNFIYLINNNIVSKPELMQGCGSNVEEFISPLQNTDSILAAEVIEKSQNAGSYKYDVLYTQDLLTGVKKPLLDLKKLDVHRIYYDKINNYVIFVGKDKTYIYDFLTLNLNRELPFSSKGVFIGQNKIYFIDYSKSKILSFDKRSFAEQVEISNINTSYLRIMGEYNGGLIIER